MSDESNENPASPEPSPAGPPKSPLAQTPSGASPDMPEYQKVEGVYGAEQLEHLSDLEHVRERPSMYIGDTTRSRAAPPGLRSGRQLDRRGDGRLRHGCPVTINNDGSVTVEDDGRGIPVEIHHRSRNFHARRA